MLNVLVTSPERVVYLCQARCVVLPGEKGTFEVLPLHRPIVSRLVEGLIEVDGKRVRIRRGVVRVSDDDVVAVVELKGEGK